ncbi:MAG: MBG domain-containing protein [Alsobacter sp.]
MPNYGPIDANLALRTSATAVTATTNDSSLAFDGLAQESFAALFDVTALTVAGATITLEVQLSADSAFTVPVSMGTVVPSAVGQYEISMSGQEITQRLATAAFIRSRVTITGGTSPSITYNAWVVPPYRT